jgi:hypothetical protein
MASTRVGGVNGIKVVSTSRAEAGGTLRSLTDTQVVNPQTDYVLVYNAASGLWVAQATLGTGTEVDGGTF